MIEYEGDLFDAHTFAIGHGVNCRGLMGAGIAKAFRSRYPKMYWEYRLLCEEGLLKPGQIFPWAAGNPVVINIASQEYPGPDAKIHWLEHGIESALQYCRERELESLAIPRIGCGIGGLKWLDVHDALLRADGEYPDVRLEVWTPGS